jgi:hypothetical protein
VLNAVRKTLEKPWGLGLQYFYSAFPDNKMPDEVSTKQRNDIRGLLEGGLRG